MADYLSLAAFVFIINVMPAFMPPTWIPLALAKINDPSIDILTLVLVGAISSTLGRLVLAYYSSFFRILFTKELVLRAQETKSFFEYKAKEIFIGTLIYALSPFPSNFVFIARGLTEVDPKPIFAGFFIGRFISYFTLVTISQHAFYFLGNTTEHVTIVKYAFDILGILAGFSFVLIDWKKVSKMLGMQ